MLFENIDLPETVKMYMTEICSNDELKEAFRDFDVEVFDEERVREFEEDRFWLDIFMDHGECSYSKIKPFALEATGAVWAMIDDRLVGYIGTEGECGIVARNIHEFMNIVSVWGGYLNGYWYEDVLASEEAFYSTMNDPERLSGYMPELERHRSALQSFIERHGFTGEIYEMALRGVTVTPFLVFKATTDEYEDSDSILCGSDRYGSVGQEVLERLIQRVALS